MNPEILSKWEQYAELPVESFKVVPPTQGNLACKLVCGTDEYHYASVSVAKSDLKQIHGKIMCSHSTINWVGVSAPEVVKPIELLDGNIRAEKSDGTLFEDSIDSFFIDGIKPKKFESDELVCVINMLTELNRDKVLEMVDSVKQGEPLEQQQFFLIGWLNILTKGKFIYDKVVYDNVEDFKNMILRSI
jgi:hypothetical protein